MESSIAEFLPRSFASEQRPTTLKCHIFILNELLFCVSCVRPFLSEGEASERQSIQKVLAVCPAGKRRPRVLPCTACNTHLGEHHQV